MSQYGLKYYFTKGQKVGSLVVINELDIDDRPSRTKRAFFCLCDCGYKSTVRISVLLGKRTPCCEMCSLKRRKKERKEKAPVLKKEALKAFYGNAERAEMQTYDVIEEEISFKYKELSDESAL